MNKILDLIDELRFLSGLKSISTTKINNSLFIKNSNPEEIELEKQKVSDLEIKIKDLEKLIELNNFISSDKSTKIDSELSYIIETINKHSNYKNCREQVSSLITLLREIECSIKTIKSIINN